jgi:hypothetical protein
LTAYASDRGKVVLENDRSQKRDKNLNLKIFESSEPAN